MKFQSILLGLFAWASQLIFAIEITYELPANTEVKVTLSHPASAETYYFVTNTLQYDGGEDFRMHEPGTFKLPPPVTYRYTPINIKGHKHLNFKTSQHGTDLIFVAPESNPPIFKMVTSNGQEIHPVSMRP